MNVSMEKILYTWSEGYDGGHIPKDKEQRIAAFFQLFKDLEANILKETPELTKEKLKEEVEEIVLRNKESICEMCWNENHRNKKGLAIWKDMVRTNLKQAIARYSPSETGAPVTEEELAFKKTELPNIPEPQPEPARTSSIINVPELDRSIFDGLPKVNVIYDEELEKLLGFDNE